LDLGGTANLAVLGGNLPPSFGTIVRTNMVGSGRTKRGGRVARHNGPVARSTQMNRSANRTHLQVADGVSSLLLARIAGVPVNS
jgi:hypothetical protein